MFICAALHLALCGRASSVRGSFGGKGQGIGEGRGGGGGGFIHQPTPGLWSMKKAPQKTAAARHSDKTLQIVSLIKNLSCRNTIDSKRGRENRQPEPKPPPSYTYTDLPSLSFSLSLLPKLHPNLYIPHINPRMGAVCRGMAVCKPHCKYLCHPPRSVTNPGRHCK